MFNKPDTTRQNGAGEDRKTLRRLELVAHATTTAAFLLTIYLVKSAYASELNVVAESLFGTIGWAATGVVAIAVIAVAFVLYDRHLESYPRLILGAGAVLALAGVLDLSVNLYILARMGFPESFWWEGYFPLYAPVAVVGAVALARHRIARRLEPVWSRVREARQKYSRALSVIAIVMLIATSVVAVPFLGGLATDRADHNGTATATEAGEDVYIGTNSGNGDEFKSWDESDWSENWNKGDETHNIQESPDRGEIYASRYDGTNYRVEAVDEQGNVLWTKSLGSDQIDDMFLGPNQNYLYVGSFDQNVYKLDLSNDGAIEWQTDVGDDVYAVAASENWVFAVSNSFNTNNGFHKLDAADGSVDTASTSLGGSQFTDLGIAPDRQEIYTGSSSLKALDYNLNEQWSVTTDSNPVEILADEENGDIYVGQRSNGFVQKRSLADGSVNWNVTTSSNSIAGLTLSSDKNEVFAGNANGELYDLDAGTGSQNRMTSVASIEDVHSNDRFATTLPLTGTVSDKNGDPIQGAAVGADHPDVPSTTTNSTGYYQLDVPEAGTYDVTADDGDYVQTKSVDVPDGGISGVEFALGPGDPAGQSVGLLEDDLGFFPADDTELVVYERSTEYKSIEDGMSVETWHETTWSETDRATFNWENRTRVDLVNGRYYRLELVSSHGHWEDSGFLYNDTEMSGSTIWLEPDTSSTDTNGDGTSGGSGSSGGDSWDDTGTPTPDENGDFPTATEQQGFGPTALGKCTTLDGQDGVEVEYWDPGWETHELEANLTVDGSTTYYVHKIWDDPRGYYRGCIADSMTDNASSEGDLGLNHSALDGEGNVVSTGSKSFSAPTFGPSGKAPASTAERAGLLAAVLGALGVLWFGGNRYVPASSVKSWPSESISPAFAIGGPVVAVLGLDLAGGGVISAGVATGLAQIAPFAGIVGVTVGGYYALRWIRAPPST